MSKDALVGYVERLSAKGIVEGWVSALAGSPVELEFLVDGLMVGSCDLGGPIRMGAVRTFGWPLPHRFFGVKDAAVVTARLKDGRPLGGKASFDHHAARFVGLVSEVGAGAISGFARDVKCPERPVVLSLFCGPAIVALGVTGQISRGAASDGFSASDGFVIPVPVDWHAMPSLRFNVFVANTAVRLNDTPLFMFMGADARMAGSHT